MPELPKDFETKMKQDLGSEFNDFENALAQDVPISVRLNPRKETALALNRQEAVPWCSNAFYLSERPVFTLDPSFHAGAYYVQEASSMFLKAVLSQHIDFSKSIRVLDLCAAPGGKTTLLADLLNEESLLVANEVIKSRVGILKENLMKWGYTNVIVSNHDPEEFADLEGFFDLVLVDAPCSGEGLFRKDPNATSHWSEDAVNTCSARQKRILEAASMLVAPHGHLIYSTCTYNEKENEGNVNWFIKNCDFEEQKIDISKFHGIQAKERGYQFYPHKVKGEGFFISILKKIEGHTDYVGGKLKMNRLSTKKKEFLTEWLADLNKFEFFEKPDETVVAIPTGLIDEYSSVLRALTKRSSGFELGLFKKENFIPSHSLALSTEVNQSFPVLELEREDALRFLKRESFDQGEIENGWKLVTYNGLGLGWIKIIGNRANNYLPKEWRIRMDIE